MSPWKGGASDTSLFCNDEPLSSPVSDGCFALPGGLPTESRIAIEAMSGAAVLARRSLFLTGDFSLPSLGRVALPEEPVSRPGQPDSRRPQIQGVHVLGDFSPRPATASERLEDMRSELGDDECFLVGSVPGQIVAWPRGSLPETWKPVWAIKLQRRRRGRAVFLGEGLEGVSPQQGTAGTPREIRKWREVLWYWRKRIKPPPLASLRDLWSDYQKVARDV